MRVLVLTGHDWALLNYRGPLLRAIVAAGHEVLAAAPPENPDVIARFAGQGIRFVPAPIARQGLNPLKDVGTLFGLRAMFQRERPQVVLSYAIKSVVYGSMAARWAGVPRVYALIVGLGAAFHRPGLKGALMRSVATSLYRGAGRCCDRVFAQNADIRDLFVRKGIARAECITVVPGSGVDTERFAAAPLPDGPPVFVYVGRLLRDKGVGEFVAAARRLKPLLPAARFVLVGDTDRNPASFTPVDVAGWRSEGVVESLGFAQDVQPFLRASTVFVLPSYHEGVPLSVLEAMAVGRPIVTTETMGCRDTIALPRPDSRIGLDVKRGANGFLVPVRRSEPLAAAMLALAHDRALVESMARESRRLAETVFNVQRVNRMMLEGMGL